jgi:hypothetical protein
MKDPKEPNQQNPPETPSTPIPVYITPELPSTDPDDFTELNEGVDRE